MFKHYFEQVDNIEIWPVMALIIFFVFFTGLIVYIIKLDKKFVKKMENMPFNDSENLDNDHSQKIETT